MRPTALQLRPGGPNASVPAHPALAALPAASGLQSLGSVEDLEEQKKLKKLSKNGGMATQMKKHADKISDKLDEIDSLKVKLADQETVTLLHG